VRCACRRAHGRCCERHAGRCRRPSPSSRRSRASAATAPARSPRARSGAPHVAVDANVRRVGARVLDLETPSDVELEHGLAALLLADDDADARRGDVSEALIELGATVCGARTPACARCPLRQACRAHVAGRATSVPAPRARQPRRSEGLTLLVALRGTEVALAQRPVRGRWAGLWGFPSGDAAGMALPGFEHHLTHRRLEVTPRLVRAEALVGTLTWMPLERVAAGGDRHPVAAVDQRLARLLVAPAGRAALHAAAARAAERRTA
jgi:adenine-specific DNA glycosylase